jgi:hypothetical protein
MDYTDNLPGKYEPGVQLPQNKFWRKPETSSYWNIEYDFKISSPVVHGISYLKAGTNKKSFEFLPDLEYEVMSVVQISPTSDQIRMSLISSRVQSFLNIGSTNTMYNFDLDRQCPESDSSSESSTKLRDYIEDLLEHIPDPKNTVRVVGLKQLGATPLDQIPDIFYVQKKYQELGQLPTFGIHPKYFDSGGGLASTAHLKFRVRSAYGDCKAQMDIDHPQAEGVMNDFLKIMSVRIGDYAALKKNFVKEASSKGSHRKHQPFMYRWNRNTLHGKLYGDVIGLFDREHIRHTKNADLFLQRNILNVWEIFNLG